VNKVCFCFPFFFAFPDPTSAAFALPLLCSSSSGILAAEPTAPLVQADPTGSVSPKICFSDWLPLTAVFCFAELEAGSSGNRVFDKGTGAPAGPGATLCTSVVPGPGTENGKRTPDAALDDQGVTLEGWRNAGTTAGSAGGNAGKRSGGLGIGAGMRAGAEDDDPAACATRSKSCLDDC